MITLRAASARGHYDHGWLDTYHTFSFADYYDPQFEAFSVLRVLNEDRVAGGAGFPSHSHRDMEILTWVLEGALAHKDSLGNGSVIRPGDLQRMSAGTGVVHSEHNASSEELVHFLQIWIIPNRRGIAPGYEEKPIDASTSANGLHIAASSDGRNGSVTIHQDATLYIAKLALGGTAQLALQPGRRAWVQVSRGDLELGSQPMHSGDGAALEAENAIHLRALSPCEALVFDLP